MSEWSSGNQTPDPQISTSTFYYYTKQKTITIYMCACYQKRMCTNTHNLVYTSYTAYKHQGNYHDISDYMHDIAVSVFSLHPPSSLLHSTSSKTVILHIEKLVYHFQMKYYSTSRKSVILLQEKLLQIPLNYTKILNILSVLLS